MPRAVGVGSYRAVFELPFALRTFVPAIGGRLAYGLFPLASLFTVQQASGSFATAGLAAAGFGVTAITMPAKARLAERYSQRVVLPPQALVCASALVAAAMAVEPVVLVGLITVAGLAAPPLGPAMRANWRRLTAGTSLKPRAYGLDSVVEETLYLVGPLIAGLLVAAGPARWALVLTAALLLVGTLGMVTTPVALQRERMGGRPVRGEQANGGVPAIPAEPTIPAERAIPAEPAIPGEPARGGPMAGLFGAGALRSGGLRGLLAVILAVGAGTSVAYTCLAVTAQDHGKPGAAGLLEAALALGSVAGGLFWSRRDFGPNRRRQLGMLVGALAVGLSAASVTSGLVVLGLVLCVTGTALAPVYVVAYLAADDLAGECFATEAGTWVNVATNAGSAAGAAIAGIVAEAWGAGVGFFSGGTLLAVTAGAVAVTSRRGPREQAAGSRP
ncbi:MFS transporter [Actinoplanes solisilvae]|uniref:MFS transporter n=1 Tax=Actinoplanes solisilvae TaxID=2486853 RepID=UPI000FD830BA|nr:MFS transporter [Actinoplanes solisilvae]